MPVARARNYANWRPGTPTSYVPRTVPSLRFGQSRPVPAVPLPPAPLPPMVQAPQPQPQPMVQAPVNPVLSIPAPETQQPILNQLQPNQSTFGQVPPLDQQVTQPPASTGLNSLAMNNPATVPAPTPPALNTLQPGPGTFGQVPPVQTQPTQPAPAPVQPGLDQNQMNQIRAMPGGIDNTPDLAPPPAPVAPPASDTRYSPFQYGMMGQQYNSFQDYQNSFNNPATTISQVPLAFIQEQAQQGYRPGYKNENDSIVANWNMLKQASQGSAQYQNPYIQNSWNQMSTTEPVKGFARGSIGYAGG